MFTVSIYKYFTTRLLHWHVTENKRIMPWKGEKNPYKVWLSEIILQQTRVAQGLLYYEKFLLVYPTVELLAAAQDDEVYKMWEGLGYYSRCKNLLASARAIVKAGKFPNTYDDILNLKGVGAYTASAIASFAFALPYAVVDGNVYRVLSRFFGESVPIDSTKGKKFFNELATKLLYQPDSSAYNQAIMDFGAIICTPRLPLCYSCPLQKKCLAFKNDLVNDLPVKEKSLVIKSRWFTYFVFTYNHHFLVRQRVNKDIWAGLHEFYLEESPAPLNWTTKKLQAFIGSHFQLKTFEIKNISEPYRQQLTHQTIAAQFIAVEIKEIPEALKNCKLIALNNVSKWAFPKIINHYLSENMLARG